MEYTIGAMVLAAIVCGIGYYKERQRQAAYDEALEDLRRIIRKERKGNR